MQGPIVPAQNGERHHPPAGAKRRKGFARRGKNESSCRKLLFLCSVPVTFLSNLVPTEGRGEITKIWCLRPVLHFHFLFKAVPREGKFYQGLIAVVTVEIPARQEILLVPLVANRKKERNLTGIFA